MGRLIMPKYRVIATHVMHYEVIIEGNDEESVDEEVGTWEIEDFEYHAIPVDSYGTWEYDIIEEEENK